jgi:hypothetical protein
VLNELIALRVQVQFFRNEVVDLKAKIDVGEGIQRDLRRLTLAVDALTVAINGDPDDEERPGMRARVKAIEEKEDATERKAEKNRGRISRIFWAIMTPILASAGVGIVWAFKKILKW